MIAILFAALAFAKTTPELRSVELSWRAHDLATHYVLEVARNPVMDPIITTRKPVAPSEIVKLKPGVYYFRVRGISKQNVPGPWTDPEPFVVNALPPKPIYPPEAASLSGFDSESGIRFEWSAGPLNKELLFEVSDERGVVLNRTVKGLRFDWLPPNPGTYRWRVGYSALNRQEWGDYQSFSISAAAFPKETFSFMDEALVLWEGGIRTSAFLQSLSGTNRDTFITLAPSSVFASSFDAFIRRALPRASPGAFRWTGALLFGLGRLSISGQDISLGRIDFEASGDRMLDRFRIGPWFRIGLRQSLLVVPINNAPAQVNVLRVGRWRTLFGAMGAYQLGRHMLIEASAGLGWDMGGADSSLSGSLGADFCYAGAVGLRYSVWGPVEVTVGVGISQELSTWNALTGERNFFRVDRLSGTLGVQVRF